MSSESRLARLERLKRSAPVGPGPSCAVIRPLSMHDEYKIIGGETLVLPPIEHEPPCTCGRKGRDGMKITGIIIVRCDEVTREEAERDHREHGDQNQAWKNGTASPENSADA